jgi:hypothetical protein
VSFSNVFENFPKISLSSLHSKLDFERTSIALVDALTSLCIDVATVFCCMFCCMLLCPCIVCALAQSFFVLLANYFPASVSDNTLEALNSIRRTLILRWILTSREQALKASRDLNNRSDRL